MNISAAEPALGGLRRDCMWMEMTRFFHIALMAAMVPPAARVFADPPASAPAGDVVRLGVVSVDRAERTVTIPARVVKPGYMLEFFLCRTGTKEYESILATDALPHRIHAALLLLGLAPGLPAQTAEGTFLPPRGARVAMELRWTDQAGVKHTVPASDWLADSGKASKEKSPAKPARWIFVGSDITPGGGYLADQAGGIIAVANVADAVLDVPFASTKSLRERRFVLNKKTTPPPGTKVDLILKPDKNAASADYARALLEIDPQGRLAMDGLPVAMEKLTAWAENFSTDHKYARVVIRSAAETPAGFAPRARMELKLGGIYDFEFRVAPEDPPLLPRTKQQLQTTLNVWKERFATPEDQLDDPAQSAEQILRQIERRRAEQKKLDELWSRYAEALRKMRQSNK
ncbi:MAG: hypothetical protein JXA11_01745 [Phycisphaerae bacterium]|nr:hypothetical protein [Phycisphaerae bacterium]